MRSSPSPAARGGVHTVGGDPSAGAAFGKKAFVARRTDEEYEGGGGVEPRRWVRVLRLLGWNVLLTTIGLALIAAAGETWLRLTIPFMHRFHSLSFVPGVGVLYEPGSEVRSTNRSEFWTVSRANRWGFFDRPPPSPERTASGCHVTLIGDSFVEATQVPIADKVQVRLEELARRRLPHLDVTTSAFGISGTGQVHQLRFYDHYARRLHPRLLVLVFVPNDFPDNSPILKALRWGFDPDRPPYATAVRGADGGFELRPPDPEYDRFRLFTDAATTLTHRSPTWMSRRSWFVAWVARETGVEALRFSRLQGWKRQRWRELLSQRPGYEWLGEARLDRYLMRSRRFTWVFAEEDLLPPVFSEALAATGFALDEFKARADRDGAALVILATHLVGLEEGRLFDRLLVLARARGIPVIDQHGYIVRQGGDPRAAQWGRNVHWTPAGHQWAAEALFEWLERHQDVCGARTPRAG